MTFNGTHNNFKISADSKRSSEEIRAVSRGKDDIPEGPDDYETGLINLWGEETLEQLRHYVSVAEIEDHHIQTMATKMGVKRIYNENCHRVDLVETFERMLKGWFNQNLFDFEPSEAKDELLKVLTDGRCDERIVREIERLC